MRLRKGTIDLEVGRLPGTWGLRGSVAFFLLMTGPIPLPKIYPANLWLCYRGIRYRPAALQLFVANGGWGVEYRQTQRTRAPVKRGVKRADKAN